MELTRYKKDSAPEQNTLIVSLSDYSSDLETGVREVFDCPCDLEIVGIYAKAIQTPAGDIVIDIIEINESIFTNKLIIDGQSNDSRDSQTPVKLKKYILNRGNRIYFIIDSLATVSPGGALKVYIDYIKLYR
jgi:hypothetical protein